MTNQNPELFLKMSSMERDICNLQYIQDDCDREGSTRMMMKASREKLAALKFERALILSRISWEEAA